jgi:hypothetical protein
MSENIFIIILIVAVASVFVPSIGAALSALSGIALNVAAIVAVAYAAVAFANIVAGAIKKTNTNSHEFSYA